MYQLPVIASEWFHLTNHVGVSSPVNWECLAVWGSLQLILTLLKSILGSGRRIINMYQSHAKCTVDSPDLLVLAETGVGQGNISVVHWHLVPEQHLMV